MENRSEDVAKRLFFSSMVTAGVSAEGGISFFGNGATVSAGWKNEAGWGITKTWDSSQVNSHQVNVVNMKSLLSESLVFNIPVLGRQCTGVSPTDSSLRGAYICATKAVAQTVTETWYSISQTKPSGAVIEDLGDVADLGWTKIIRGTGNYSEFVKTVQDRSKTIVFERDQSMVDATSTYGSTWGKVSGVVPLLNDGNIPGVVFNTL